MNHYNAYNAYIYDCIKVDAKKEKIHKNIKRKEKQNEKHK